MQKTKLRKSLFFLVLWIVGGIVLGNLIGILGYYEIIPKRTVGIVPKICFGSIVLIIDGVCIWGIIYHTLYRAIDADGESVTGIIEDVTTIPKLSQLHVDEWQQQARYSCTVSYTVGQKAYKKEFPCTAFISRQELYPHIFEKGREIPIKHHKKHPRFSMIDIDVLKQGFYAENWHTRLYLAAFLIMLNVTFVAFLWFA